MRRTVSLSEFMPYGAPELLAARRPHLALALTISSAMAILLFAIALKIVPLGTIDLPKPMPTVVTIDFPRVPPAIEIEKPVSPPREPSKISRDAIPVPVPDPVAPPATRDLPPALSSDGHGEGVIDIPTSAPGPGAAPPARLPNVGEYVPVDELPVVAHEFKPPYPDLAKEAGVEGLVIVHALIGVDGHVMRVQVDPKYSIPLLDESALDAAKKWVFKPAFANGHPVAVWFALPFRFVLHE